MTTVNFESVLCVYGDNNELVGFYRNDISVRAVKFYAVSEMGLEDIKSLHERNQGQRNNPDQVGSSRKTLA